MRTEEEKIFANLILSEKSANVCLKDPTLIPHLTGNIDVTAVSQSFDEGEWNSN